MPKLIGQAEHNQIITYKTFLTSESKEKRLVFCQANKRRNWKNVMFSDELVIQTYKHRLIVWGAITCDEMLDLVVIPGRLSRQTYIADILDPVVKPYHASHPNMVFQQDNAGPHRANAVDRWFVANGIQKLTWPTTSSDLNIIENIWQILKEEIGDLSRIERNQCDRLVNDAWDRIRTTRPQLLQQLYRSMKSRVNTRIRKKGGHV